MKRLITVILLMFVAFVGINAQNTGTHAHSTTRHWKGMDVLDMLANPGNYGDFATNGKKIYLYNVGTGRFLIDGGSWAMEGRLFHDDFGRRMTLYRDATNNYLYIRPGIEEETTSVKRNLICNIPGVTRAGSTNTWARSDGNFCVTLLLDGHDDYRRLYFERVEDPSNTDTYSYRIYQRFSTKYQGYSNLTYRMGAVWGEFCSDGTTVFDSGKINKKGCGYYIKLDDDRSCWTTAGEANNSEVSPYGNHTKMNVGGTKVDGEWVGGEMVEIDELYQWRLISEDEFIHVMTEETVGINPSISSLVPDRDFTRNAKDFFGFWETEAFNSTTPAAGEGRYGWTWGEVSFQTQQQKYYNESWDAPVMLKKVWNSFSDAKYGFMSFEGVGTASVTFDLPHPGWYEIDAVSASFGPTNHPTYLYACAGGVDPESIDRFSPMAAYQGYNQVVITQFEGPANLATFINADLPVDDQVEFPSNTAKNLTNLNLAVGKCLTLHRSKLADKFWVYVNPTNFALGGDYRKMTIGVRKENATKSGSKTNTSDSSDTNLYYYDKDWVCLDDILVSYMGLAPCFLYEWQENLDYLVYDADHVSERPSASPDFHYSGSVSLERTFTKDAWNTFSLPIPLIGEQVRLAFGEECKLLELHSIGGLTQNSNIIDFVTVDLKPDDPYRQVVVPGKLYMLWPTTEPIDGKDAFGEMRSYYELGRNFFSVKQNEDPDYPHFVMNTNTLYENSAVNSWSKDEIDVIVNGDNDGVAYVSYSQSPGYSTWSVYKSGENKGKYNGTANPPVGSYVPKGGYAMSGGSMYELNKDTRIKGFRGWITLDHSIFADSNTPALISINGIVDNGDTTTDIDITSIVPLHPSQIKGIYDLTGRKLNMTIDKLPSGVYIVDGKKMFVR